MAKSYYLLVVLVLSLVCPAYGQGVKVHGVVKDELGNPLPQVLVEILETKTSTKTDKQGQYELSVPQGTKAQGIVLRFSLSGMLPQEQKSLGGVLDIVLQRSESSSDSDLKSINTSGRGATSISGNARPLWVLDGVVLESDIDISLDELASPDARTLIANAVPGVTIDNLDKFEVLRDASSTSIYGSRAIAGVVRITTRQGQLGTNSLSYTGEFVYRPIPSYSDYNIMNSQQHTAFLMDMIKAGYLGIANSNLASTTGVIGHMYQLLSTPDAEGKPMLENTPEGKTAFLRQAERRNTNWFDELYQNSIQHKHTINISSGNNKVSYFVSGSALIDPGWSRYNKEREYSGSVNVTYQIKPRLSFNFITNATYGEEEFPATSSSHVAYVDAQSAGAAQSSLFRSNPLAAPLGYALTLSRTLSPEVFYKREYAPFRVQEELESNTMEKHTMTFKMQGRLTWRPIPQLNLQALIAVKHQNVTQTHDLRENSNIVQAYRAMQNDPIRKNNSYLRTDPNDPLALPNTVLPLGGLRNESQARIGGMDYRLTASYAEQWRDGRHKLNLFVGSEINELEAVDKWHRDFGVMYELGELPAFSPEAFLLLNEKKNTYYTTDRKTTRLVSFFGNTAYTWLNRYTLEGTLRYDGSNRYGKARNARWLPNWNISLDWDVAQEAFFPKRGVLSALGVKASYGLVSDHPSVDNISPMYGAEIPWRGNITSPPAINLTNFANTDLTYEKTYELNLNLRAGLLKNRLSASFSWYHRQHDDLIGSATTQGLNGWIRKRGNVAQMHTTGVELSLSSTNLRTKHLQWSTSLAFSYRSNEVTRLETSSTVSNMTSGSGFSLQGYPRASVFSIPFLGLNERGLPTFIGPDGQPTISGIVTSGREVDFLRYSGTTEPKGNGNLGNTLRYKGFTLSVYISYSFGNVLRLSRSFSTNYSEVSALGREFVNRWQQAGDERTTNIPKISTVLDNREDSNLSRAYVSYNYSDARIARGDYIRLREISLTYKVAPKFASKIGLKSLSCKLQASNLFLIYADKRLNGRDPAYYNSAVPRQLNLTLNIGL